MDEDDRDEADLGPGTIDNPKRVFAPEINVELLWDGVSLAIALALYAILVTVVGVLIAGAALRWLLFYAVVSFLFLGMLIFARWLREPLIRVFQKYLRLRST